MTPTVMKTLVKENFVANSAIRYKFIIVHQLLVASEKKLGARLEFATKFFAK